MTNENKRLIDANAFCRYLADAQLANRGWKDDFCEFLDDLMDSLNEFPAVDAVEVVRCKDCKHWSDGVAGCTDHVKCCEIGFYIVGENGYCVYGERRTYNGC